MNKGSIAWRALFVLGGALIIKGGSMHPGGEMKEMLMHPEWTIGHTINALGFLALCIGMFVFRRVEQLPPRTLRLTGIAVVTLFLEVVEMTVHTLSSVDADALPMGELMAGAATPVLTTHMWLATFIYPISGIVLVMLIWTGMRERSLGSPWFGWLGMIGAATHAAVIPLVLHLRLPVFGIFFPMITFLAFWFCLAGVWPRRKGSEALVAA